MSTKNLISRADLLYAFMAAKSEKEKEEVAKMLGFEKIEEEQAKEEKSTDDSDNSK
jgi:hypothetical protein